MTWRCPNCRHEKHNAYWKGACAACGTPRYGEEPGVGDERLRLTDERNQLMKAIEELRSPMDYGFSDCGCPTSGICMSTACPRAARITNYLNGGTSGVGFPD